MDFNCYHYDIARGAYLKPETFKEALKLAAGSGFTHFLPYLENMIRLTPMAKACPDCAYTPDQWRDFDDAAAAAGIELIPHFNVIGHSTQVCQLYPELAGRPGEDELDVTLPAVREWTVACLEEYCSFSKGRHFLVGGDEWQPPNHNLADPAFNVAEAWVGQVNLAVQTLVGHGRVPIVWHDMLLHYPEALAKLSRDAVIAFWFYDEDSDYPALSMFREMGFKTIMASGLCDGLLTHRRRRALECAVAAREKHHAYGLMFTSWSDCRWERQSLNIPLVGKVIKGEAVPAPLLDAISRAELSRRVQGWDATYTEDLEAELRPLLADAAWDDFPLCKTHLAKTLAGDAAGELELYHRWHCPGGPLFQAAPALTTEFRLDIATKSLGPELKLRNGDESFVIYPDFGATLQGLEKGGFVVIPHELPAFVGRDGHLPGGYRSYTGAGGFRPIWAFGSHHNPCVLWQGPFAYKVEEAAGVIVVRLSRSMPHVEVVYTVTVRQDVSGFGFAAEAVNQVEGAYGSFNFNLPLCPPTRATTFRWPGGSLRLGDVRDSFFVLPPSDKLVVDLGRAALAIESDPAQTAGFYTDWAPSFITPDLRGVYRKLREGEHYKASWRFSFMP